MRASFLAIASLVVLAALPAAAQPTMGPLRAGFGTSISYSSASGEVDAAIYGQTPDAACSGFIGVQPSHRVNLETEFADLRMRVDSYGLPASLVVYGPNGRRCSGLPTVNPELGGPWPAGRYTIYVGAQTQYGWVSYDLLVAETAADLERLALERSGYLGYEGGEYWGYEEPVYGELLVGEGGLGVGEYYMGEGVGTLGEAAPVPAAAEPAADPSIAAAERPARRETITIDPEAITALIFDGDIAQEVAANELAPEASSCSGMVGINPDFAIQVSEPMDTLLLEVSAASGPSIVRYGPVGSAAAGWTCVVAVLGAQARLGGEWAPGRYLVWLGSTGGPATYQFTIAAAP